MKNTTESSLFSVSGLVLSALYLIVGLATLYFVLTRAFPYLSYSYSEKAYGKDAVLIFSHVIFGITATILGPFQFVSSIRKRNIKLHRNLGKTYLICTILGALASWAIIIPRTDSDITYQVGLFSLGFVWIGSAIMAYLSIKNKKIELHREWVVRSYVITLAFVTFRLIYDLLEPMQIKGTGALMAWACWALPLFVTELILQGRKIYK